ncbi:hypothetical protein NM688_g711 [Phlebia brevispora]|uniref:Uncharacterized protein n=1 Tax=Phlebia brevispora TaxID=194682 RepID=A0ACC1TDT5_9APHY|nr:hypothetical protein NM688_g711 [Phlebia brevispora]
MFSKLILTSLALVASLSHVSSAPLETSGVEVRQDERPDDILVDILDIALDILDPSAAGDALAPLETLIGNAANTVVPAGPDTVDPDASEPTETGVLSLPGGGLWTPPSIADPTDTVLTGFPAPTEAGVSSLPVLGSIAVSVNPGIAAPTDLTTAPTATASAVVVPTDLGGASIDSNVAVTVSPDSAITTTTVTAVAGESNTVASAVVTAGAEFSSISALPVVTALPSGAQLQERQLFNPSSLQASISSFEASLSSKLATEIPNPTSLQASLSSVLATASANTISGVVVVAPRTPGSSGSSAGGQTVVSDSAASTVVVVHSASTAVVHSAGTELVASSSSTDSTSKSTSTSPASPPRKWTCLPVLKPEECSRRKLRRGAADILHGCGSGLR